MWKLSFLFCFACGARSNLDATDAVSSSGTQTIDALGCVSARTRTSPCASWKPGVAKPIASSTRALSVVRGGCRDGQRMAFVFWNSNLPSGPSLSWQGVDFDGTPVASPREDIGTDGNAFFSFASNDEDVGVLSTSGGSCNFFSIDAQGEMKNAETIAREQSYFCAGLAFGDSKWSFIKDREKTTLAFIDPSASTDEVLLDTDPHSLQGSTRFVFDDGSFFLEVFRANEIFIPYDDTGNEIASPIILANGTGKPMLVPTESGAFLWWTPSSFAVLGQPLDRFGKGTGPLRTVFSSDDDSPRRAQIFGARDGELLLVTIDDLSTMSFQAVSAKGVARGAPTSLALDWQSAPEGDFYGIFDVGGDRAILVFSTQNGIETLPLTCQ